MGKMGLSYWWLVVSILALAFSSCGNTSTLSPMEGQMETKISIPISNAGQLQFGYTHQRPDGNRMMLGRGSLPEVSPIDIPLTGSPEWVVAAPVGSDTL